MHRLGGLETEANTGHVSYDASNHQQMIRERAKKVQAVTRFYGPLSVEVGAPTGDLLVVGWGSTYGALRTAVEALRDAGHAVTHVHLKHLFPLHPDFFSFMEGFSQIVVAELNEGQLIHVLRSQTTRELVFLGQTSGQPFGALEVQQRLAQHLSDA